MKFTVLILSMFFVLSNRSAFAGPDDSAASQWPAYYQCLETLSTLSGSKLGKNEMIVNENGDTAKVVTLKGVKTEKGYRNVVASEKKLIMFHPNESKSKTLVELKKDRNGQYLNCSREELGEENLNSDGIASVRSSMESFARLLNTDKDVSKGAVDFIKGNPYYVEQLRKCNDGLSAGHLKDSLSKFIVNLATAAPANSGGTPRTGG